MELNIPNFQNPLDLIIIIFTKSTLANLLESHTDKILYEVKGCIPVKKKSITIDKLTGLVSGPVWLFSSNINYELPNHWASIS